MARTGRVKLNLTDFPTTAERRNCSRLLLYTISQGKYVSLFFTTPGTYRITSIVSRLPLQSGLFPSHQLPWFYKCRTYHGTGRHHSIPVVSSFSLLSPIMPLFRVSLLLVARHMPASVTIKYSHLNIQRLSACTNPDHYSLASTRPHGRGRT